MNGTDRKEILFYYESKDGANPNGDPGFDDQPRQLPDQTILVTDLRLKRTIRDYAKKQGHVNFVDYNEDGNAVIAIDRVGEILGQTWDSNNRVDPDEDYIESLMNNTFDTNLFGAFVPVDEKLRASRTDHPPDGGPSWYKLTGAVQFGLGRSVNQVEIWHPTISAHFKGDKKTTSATLGRFWGVEYALIKFGGGINPSVLENYLPSQTFDNAEELLLEYLWESTNELHSRSKYPQRSIFYLEVTYDKTIYNDLTNLIEDKMTGKQKTLLEEPFGTEKLVKKLNSRKNIKEIRIRCCSELEEWGQKLAEKLEKAQCV